MVIDSDSESHPKSEHTPPRKRKAPSLLSDNPHTVKVRKRNEAISQDPVREKVEKAKRADQGAITYAKSKLMATNAYQRASESVKKAMDEESARKVKAKRYVR